MLEKSAASWNVDGRLARLNCGELRAEFDLTCPAGGIQSVVYRRMPLQPFQLFRMTGVCEPDRAGESLPDFYVRGVDLVTSSVETPDSAVSRQMYWRALLGDDPLTCGVELWVSSQTSLLETDPVTACSCRLPAGDVHRLSDAKSDRFSALPVRVGESVELTAVSGGSAFLFRPPGADWSCAAMIHPADFTRATIAAGQGELSLETELFAGEHLEKGVIRRVRLRCLLLPRRDDAARARDSYRDFVSGKLPLTT